MKPCPRCREGTFEADGETALYYWYRCATCWLSLGIRKTAEVILS